MGISTLGVEGFQSVDSFAESPSNPSKAPLALEICRRLLLMIQSNAAKLCESVLQDLIKIFNDHELELLISGLPEIDVDDLRANTEYSGYTAAAPVIQWFWEIVRGLEKQDLALLVQFVTGTSKVPLEGFKALQVCSPHFLTQSDHAESTSPSHADCNRKS